MQQPHRNPTPPLPMCGKPISSFNLNKCIYDKSPMQIILYQFNSLRPRRNKSHFVYDSFKCIFLNDNVLISIKISCKFIPKSLISNIPALFQIMAWRRIGGKPLSEPMMVLTMHNCVTGPQWVKRDIPLWKKPKCPQCMQWPWWQTMATLHTGLRV